MQLYTPLHVATHSGHEQIVQVLLEHDADPNTISEVHVLFSIITCKSIILLGGIYTTDDCM